MRRQENQQRSAEQGSHTVKGTHKNVKAADSNIPLIHPQLYQPLCPSHPPAPSLGLAHDTSLSFSSARTSLHPLSIHFNAIPATTFLSPRQSNPPQSLEKESHLSSGFQTVGFSSKSGAVYMRASQSAASASSSFFVNFWRSHFSHFVSASAELVSRAKRAGM